MLYNTSVAKGATRSTSRRGFLKMASAVSAATLLAADAAAAAGAVSPELADLIARYGEMRDRENEAYDKICDIEELDEFHERSSIRLIEVVECVSDYPPRLLHVPIFSEFTLKAFFETVKGVVRTVKFDSDPFYGVSFEEAKMLTDRASDFERAKVLLERRKAERDEWLRSIGWDDLQKLASDEGRNRVAVGEELAEFPCRSYADVLAKAEFVAKTLCPEDDVQDMLFTLIKSMIPALPEAQPLHA